MCRIMRLTEEERIWRIQEQHVRQEERVKTVAPEEAEQTGTVPEEIEQQIKAQAGGHPEAAVQAAEVQVTEVQVTEVQTAGMRATERIPETDGHRKEDSVQTIPTIP